MCELLGMECNVPTDIVFSFSGLRQRGGKTGPHADGWGLAFYEGRATRVFLDPSPAAHSPLAHFLSEHPIKTLLAIGHIRRRTRGPTTLANTHPFVRELWGRYWVFAHNGNLENFHPRLHASFHPVGRTDSERAFCWLMQELAKAHAAVPTVQELSCTLRELLPVPARHGSFNLLLSNGQALWAHCSTKLHVLERAHPFGHAQLADEDLRVDFAQVTQPSDRAAIVATAPLTAGEPWQALAPGEMRVFVGGRAVAAGPCLG